MMMNEHNTDFKSLSGKVWEKKEMKLKILLYEPNNVCQGDLVMISSNLKEKK